MPVQKLRPRGAIFVPAAAAVVGALVGLVTGWVPLTASAQTPAPTAPQANDRSPMASAALSTWERVTDLPAWQQGSGHWRLIGSPFTHHWRLSDEHRHVFALGVERQYDDRYLLGASLFRNSFGQPSAFAYVGRRSDGVLDRPQLFVQWSAGIIYGYRGKYESKLPMNVHGFAPGLLLSLGWQVDRQFSVTAHALGDAGVMLQLAYDFR